ncbi:MAG TPA: hypothetical protein VJ939_08500 [Bacteroidales bacterium]|nr:hypothetical protein [Bacteroidales bacterium]
MALKIIAIFLLLLSQPSVARLQTAAPAEYCRNFHIVSQLHFSQATDYLETSNASSLLKEAYRYHLKDYQLFLKIFLEEERGVFDAALEERNDFLDFWEDLPDSVPGKDYFIGDTYLRWSMLRMKFDQKMRAGWELNKAYRSLKTSIEKHPGYYPAIADIGIMEVLIGTVPERYRWVMNLLNFEGTIEQGKKKIYQVLEVSLKNEDWAYLEKPTLFMLSFVDMNTSMKVDEMLMKRLEAMDEAGEVKNEPLLIFLYADLLQKDYKNNKALEILSYYQVENKEAPFYYLLYMRGLSQLYLLDKKCIESLDYFTGNFPGLHYLKSAYQKKAWYYLLKGDTASYRNEISYVHEGGATLTGADKQALKEAEREDIPNATLLKARLLFDGGYFQEALEVLKTNNRPLKNLAERTEYDYRLGRVLHLLERNDEAVGYYQRAFAQGKELDEYFAANAMLMAGRIFMVEKEYENARESFKNCLDLSGFDYQYSIHQKARAGISEIEDIKKGTRN